MTQHAVDAPAPEAPARRERARRRVSVVGVLGELLITAGVLVLLFLGWQLWLNDIIVGAQEKTESVQQSQEWNLQDGGAAYSGDPLEPPVHAAVSNAQRFGSLLVPRFGATYYPGIAEGIGTNDVLNKNLIGHYPETALPGEIGNFALAAHRSAYGGFFHNLHQLHVGDHIFVETADGWYQYSFRNLEYVRPTGVGVLDPVPQAPEVQATERVVTLTTCNPFFSTAERLIAYGAFDKFFPRDAALPNNGAPDEVVPIVTGGAG